jgi:hypothetical protein
VEGNRSKRQRKLSRPSPPMHPEEPDDTPPVMWPSPGSGFDASPSARQEWRKGFGNSDEARGQWKRREERDPVPHAGLLARLGAWFDGQ